MIEQSASAGATVTARAIADLDPLTLLSIRSLCKTYPPVGTDFPPQTGSKNFKVAYHPDIKRWLATSH